VNLVLSWRNADGRYLLVCLVGAAVSAVAAWAALIGYVPLTVVPPSALVAGVCAVLAFEWLFAAVLVALRAERATTAAGAEPGAEPEPGGEPESAAKPTPPEEPEPLAKAEHVGAPERGAGGEHVALSESPAEPADDAEIAALQERIGQLTAALTLTAAAVDLQQVGAIVQHALTADLQLAGRDRPQ